MIKKLFILLFICLIVIPNTIQCALFDSKSLEIEFKEVVYLVTDTICNNESREYHIIKEEGSIYSWWVDGVLRQESGETISVTWNYNGYHKVEVQEITANGCGGEIAICEVQVVECSSSSMQPSAFTPNNDGLNDHFRPLLQQERGVPVTYEFIVFNKRGLILYKTTTPGEGWDGYYKGVLLPTDNYYYQLKIKYSGDKKSQKMIGSILLINKS